MVQQVLAQQVGHPLAPAQHPGRVLALVQQVDQPAAHQLVLVQVQQVLAQQEVHQLVRGLAHHRGQAAHPDLVRVLPGVRDQAAKQKRVRVAVLAQAAVVVQVAGRAAGVVTNNPATDVLSR